MNIIVFSFFCLCVRPGGRCSRQGLGTSVFLVTQFSNCVVAVLHSAHLPNCDIVVALFSNCVVADSSCDIVVTLFSNCVHCVDDLAVG